MAKDFGNASNIAILLAAIAIGGSAIYDTFLRPPARAAAGDPNAPPEYVDNWRALADVGIRLGNANAPVQIVEFADLECPFCAKYEATLRASIAKYPGKVSRVFVHFPLTVHSSARRAAQALECAVSQGRAETMMEELYRRQAEFSNNPWMSAAIASGVQDTSVYRSCINSVSEHARIERGSKAARAIELNGTPTVLVNGFMFANPPADSVLERAIQAAIDGRRVPGARSSRPSRRVSLD